MYVEFLTMNRYERAMTTDQDGQHQKIHRRGREEEPSLKVYTATVIENSYIIPSCTFPIKHESQYLDIVFTTA